MANWDIVTPYDREASEWLASQGYPHPEVRVGNRLPTLREIEVAVVTIGLLPGAPLIVDLEGRSGYFVIRGDLALELSLLRELSVSAGQLWVYPDSGAPAIIVDRTMTVSQVVASWLRSLDASDPWRLFYDEQYGEGGLPTRH